MKKLSKNWIAFDSGSTVTSNECSKLSSSVHKVTTRKDDVATLNYNLLKTLKPKTIQDLAVNSKKINEVQLWLEQNVCSSSRAAGVLLLTGPTGSGKTATINVLCDTMGIQLVEWINPIDQDFDLHYFQAQTVRFVEFFMQSKYSSLCANSTNDTRVVLIEDFPNFIIHNPSEFHGVLKKCLVGNFTVIFICTDVGGGQLDLSQKLFSQEVKEEFNITTISFNPCSVTLLKGALKRAQNIIEGQESIFCAPNADVVEAIISSAMGDIRCAINQYHFAALKDLENQIPISTNLDTSGKKRKRSKGTSIKSMLKDEKLGFFHGLGRVLNPKRISVNNSWRIQCNFDTLIEEFSTQPTTFNSFLQENYVSYFGELSDVQKAADVLSQAQIFLDKWDDRHETMLYALWISALGLMVYNEHRVSKWNQIKAPTKLKLRSNKISNECCVNQTDLLYYNIIRKDNEFHTFKI